MFYTKNKIQLMLLVASALCVQQGVKGMVFKQQTKEKLIQGLIEACDNKVSSNYGYSLAFNCSDGTCTRINETMDYVLDERSESDNQKHNTILIEEMKKQKISSFTTPPLSDTLFASSLCACFNIHKQTDCLVFGPSAQKSTDVKKDDTKSDN